jgi:hypothetical protein
VLEGINEKLILIGPNPLLGYNSLQMKTQRRLKATPLKLPPKTTKTNPQKKTNHTSMQTPTKVHKKWASFSKWWFSQLMTFRCS